MAMTPEQQTHTLKDFRFQSGEVLPELRLHCTTLGDPQGEPVILLHGTNGSAQTLLTPEWHRTLFGPGQALDLARHRVIVPDALGSGRSSKPSDGLRRRFPRYNYLDMVQAQHRLFTECLGLSRVRLMLGYSMGGMHTWLWAQHHPDFMELAVPMACMPAPMSGRNWMLRRLVIDTIQNDPEWMAGNYTTQPRLGQAALVFYSVATSGGTRGLYRLGPNRAAADAWLDQRLEQPPVADANDALYQYEAGADYDGGVALEKIQAQVLAINNTDDERNPPELGLMEQAMSRIPRGRSLWIPASEQTLGHATLGSPRFWKDELLALLQGH